MRWIVAGLAVLMGAGAGMAAETVSELRDYQWHHRPLIVAAPKSGEALARQQAIINDKFEGFAERDMAVIVLSGDDVTTMMGPDRVEDAAALRKTLRVAPDQFAVVLVGKDGGVKLTSEKPVAAEALFALIDSMPMRRQEMRQ